MPAATTRFNPADFDLTWQIALEFPGTEEGLSHEGTPAVKLGKKLLCRLHESGVFISIHIGFEHRDHYLERYPEAFHLPEHFRRWPYLAMWTSVRNTTVIRDVIQTAWRGLAGKRLLAAYDGRDAA